LANAISLIHNALSNNKFIVIYEGDWIHIVV